MAHFKGDLTKNGGVFGKVVGLFGASRRAGVRGPAHGGLWCRGPCAWCEGKAGVAALFIPWPLATKIREV